MQKSPQVQSGSHGLLPTSAKPLAFIVGVLQKEPSDFQESRICLPPTSAKSSVWRLQLLQSLRRSCSICIGCDAAVQLTFVAAELVKAATIAMVAAAAVFATVEVKKNSAT